MHHSHKSVYNPKNIFTQLLVQLTPVKGKIALLNKNILAE